MLVYIYIYTHTHTYINIYFFFLSTSLLNGKIVHGLSLLFSGSVIAPQQPQTNKIIFWMPRTVMEFFFSHWPLTFKWLRHSYLKWPILPDIALQCNTECIYTDQNFQTIKAQLNSSMINCTSFNCSYLIIAGSTGLIGLSDNGAIFPSIETVCFLWQTSPLISLFVCRFNSTLILACHKSQQWP